MARQNYRERRRRMCTSKRPLRNWRAAHIAVAKMRDRGHDVHAYTCPHCGQQHVGHSNQEQG